jgi:hypothetical protein
VPVKVTVAVRMVVTDEAGSELVDVGVKSVDALIWVVSGDLGNDRGCLCLRGRLTRLDPSPGYYCLVSQKARRLDQLRAQAASQWRRQPLSRRISS